jgi:hypothetical protein
MKRNGWMLFITIALSSILCSNSSLPVFSSDILILNNINAADCTLCSTNSLNRTARCLHIPNWESIEVASEVRVKWNISCEIYDKSEIISQFRGKLEVIGGQHRYRISESITEQWVKYASNALDATIINDGDRNIDNDMERMLNILHPKQKDNKVTNNLGAKDRLHSNGYRPVVKSNEASPPVIYIRSPDKCDTHDIQIDVLMDSIRIAAFRHSISLCICGVYNISTTFTLKSPNYELPHILNSDECNCVIAPVVKNKQSDNIHYFIPCFHDVTPNGLLQINCDDSPSDIKSDRSRGDEHNDMPQLKVIEEGILAPNGLNYISTVLPSNDIVHETSPYVHLLTRPSVANIRIHNFILANAKREQFSQEKSPENLNNNLKFSLWSLISSRYGQEKAAEITHRVFDR